jgi:hypothetical protein
MSPDYRSGSGKDADWRLIVNLKQIGSLTQHPAKRWLPLSQFTHTVKSKTPPSIDFFVQALHISFHDAMRKIVAT